MLDIVIVNWNSGHQLAEAILSVKEHHAGLVSSIIVVDNASEDSSLKSLNAIADKLPFRLHIISNNKNLGFAAACNHGASLTSSEYLLFLNPDARLMWNSLTVPLRYMQLPENAKVGISGIQLVDESGQVSRSCSRFPTARMYWAKVLGLTRFALFHHMDAQMIEWDHLTNREVSQVIGAFFLVRRELWDSLGGFDERFFVYFEEVDFCLRARNKGWRTLYVAEARAFHAGGGTTRQVKAIRLFYSLRSRLLFSFKHFSPASAFLLLFMTITVEPFMRVVYALFKLSLSEAVKTLAAYYLLIPSVPRIIACNKQKLLSFTQKT